MLYEKPLMTIQRVFQNPPSVSISTACKNYSELREATDGLCQLEEGKRAGMGYASMKEVPGIALDSKYGEGSRKKLHQAITSDPSWIDFYMAAARNSDGDPVEPYEKLSGVIYLPDWNELTAVVHDVKFGDDEITGEFGVAHSYISQLKRRGKLKDELEPVSVYGHVQTRDGGAVLGVRSGLSYPGGHMTVPAGSLKVYDKNGSPDADLFRGIGDELKEELGLIPSWYVRIEGIAGVFKDPALRGFVFSIPTDLPFDDITDIWNDSVDRKEHDFLFRLAEYGQTAYISRMADRRPAIMPQVDPDHPLLPSGVSVLLVGMRRYSEDDFLKTIGDLGGFFAAEDEYYVK